MLLEVRRGYISTVVSGEHSRSKTSAIIAMYDVSTTRVFVRCKTVIYNGSVSKHVFAATVAMCLCGSSVHGAWCMLPMLLSYLSKIYLESAINYDLKDRCEREKSIAAIS